MKYTLAVLLLIFFEISQAQTKDSTIQSSSFDVNRLTITSGAFVSGVVSKVRFGNKQLGIGIDVNLEDALGLNSTNFVFRGAALYRFGKTRRHAIKAAYFAFLRTSNKILETELEFNDDVYPIGTEIHSILNFTIIKFAYDYSFFKDDRVNMGIGGGFYIMPVKFELSIANNQSNEIVHFTAPLPYLSLHTDFKIVPKLYLKQGIDLLYVQLGHTTGAILDINIRMEHNTWKHFGFGGGLDFYKIAMRSESSKSNFDFIGNIEMGYTGLLIFAKYYF
ncbi:MAG: hypothetical protein L3J74_07655 [Bacteroidales bacterium]|nr:hypothetical protein [Bacteroidales bacterium]